MNVVLIHHHFDSGGVLQVVLGQLLGLASLPVAARPERLIVMHGGRAAGLRRALSGEPWRGLPIEVYPLRDLEYDSLRHDDQPAIAETDWPASAETKQPSSPALPQQLEQQLLALGLDRNDTVLHLHNPTLGKNVSLPPTVTMLAQRGWHWLLQIHDFAEDLRPENYRQLIFAAAARSPVELDAWLYPDHPRVHYATLVTADAKLVATRGISWSRITVLPNPLVVAETAIDNDSEAEQQTDQSGARRRLSRESELQISDETRYVLYPVRGIRRKHLGELLLWAAMVDQPTLFSLTLPPTTPVEKQNWERWRLWAAALQLPILFGSGLIPGVTLELNRAAANWVMTTSVAEGFGMAFLEPWLGNRPVCGRDIPVATSDFRAAGVQLERLYQTFPVVLEGPQRRAALARSAAWQANAWDELPADFRPPANFNSAAESCGPTVDFASLLPRDQIDVVRRIVTDDGYAQACREVAAEVLQLLQEPCPPATITTNRRVIAETYSPQRIATKLVAAYQRLLTGASQPASSQPAPLSTATGPQLSRASGTVLEFIAARQPCWPLRLEREIDSQPFARLAKPLSPLPTQVAPHLPEQADVRAVIFDIYGTLVISGTGDVGAAEQQPRAVALEATCQALNYPLPASPAAEIERFRQLILDHQQRARARGVSHPEVDIVEVWYHWLHAGPTTKFSDLTWHAQRWQLARQLADTFEAHANPCWTMPAALETLRQLQQAGLELGIVSNAQVFTATVVAEALGCCWGELPFAGELTFFSYRFANAKPGSSLFTAVVAALARRGITPEQAIYVGNDMLNDVWAASRAGLRTALFAGDQRSLRLRSDDPRVAGCHPDVVLTELAQITQILPRTD